ncbi:hypothetical protein HDV00_011403, partial [Rhizophlyctis rosea]
MAPVNTTDGELGFFEPIKEEPELEATPQQPVLKTEPFASQPAPSTPNKIRPPPPPSQKPQQGASQQRNETATPTIQEIEADPLTKIAEQTWLKQGAPAPFDGGLVTKIWEEHLVKSNFNLRKVMLLEFSQYLEKYLWPNFEAKTVKAENRKKSPDQHVLSIVVLVNEKFRERVGRVWDIFQSDQTKFAALFSRIMSSLISEKGGKHGISLQSLENQMVRGQCMRLVGILSWSNLTERRREDKLRRNAERRELYETVDAKFRAISKATAKEKAEFDRTFISQLIKLFIRTLNSIPADAAPPAHAIPFCERFLELMIDLESQLPIRRHFNCVFHDHLVIPICKASNLAKQGRLFHQQNRDSSMLLPTDWGSKGSESGALFAQLLDELTFYADFEIDNWTGQPMSADEMAKRHYNRIRRVQKLVFIKYKEDLEDFALANVGTIESRESLLKHFGKADDHVIRGLCEELGIRTTHVEEGSVKYEKEFLIELLIDMLKKRRSHIEQINSLPLYPDENTLFDETTVPAAQYFPNTHCLAIPKLNLQFLTIHDYLLRNFNLFRLESTYDIRQDVEDSVQRLAPRSQLDRETGSDETVFGGWARMAVPINNLNIIEVAPPRLGDSHPRQVRADISYSIGKYTDSIRREWDALRPHDVLFLLTIEINPNQPVVDTKPESEGLAFRRQYGLKYVRGCEVVELLDDDGRPVDDFISAKVPVREPKELPNGQITYVERPRLTGHNRTVRVQLDPNQYQKDMDLLSRKEQEDVYPTFNILMRRRPQENNFKAVLDTIRDLMQSELIVPKWLEQILLGYGDRAGAHYTKMAEPVRTVDFRDTFLDWGHLKESFPGKDVVALRGGRRSQGENLSPPFVLTFPKSTFAALAGDAEEGSHSVAAGVKRKLADRDGGDQKALDKHGDAIVARTYQLPNMGPYPEDQPKQNSVRFTPAQVEAIHAGTSPGLTLIVGPPGTGKTDVAVQIISNLYHNYPEQHTLLITHSNQALNQLFEKIMALDIDPRHLLRLGHGMEELETEGQGNWGKYGRVDAFLEKRIQLLAEVDRLALSLDVPGAHGHTCETAGYFYTYHIQSRWESYIHGWKGGNTRSVVVDGFPFYAYFENAPQPLFPEDATYQEAREIAEGCFRHIKNVFDQLKEIRAFELLRTRKDRSNYLLQKEAKIIALTCTHAALKRRELVQLGFKYDNVIMEEAGQILEVETFIPLMLQSPDPDTGSSRLKRVVMIGDHNQLPPVVKNQAFQKYGNMEQSMFSRFIRLEVPFVQLDKQGRSRSSIAELFRWKYDELGHGLGDLPAVQGQVEFRKGNPGFAFEYQVVDVPDFMGKGETEPRPHFVQNLGEAEYVVAVYQYMRLLGYPAEKISILTTYNGQRELIQDVLDRRCSWNPLFGNPAHVATVDKFQGQQNDYILLSLVRTKTVGHLRDVRRLIVAMSRARLGLYVFCRAKLFSNCYELQPVMEQLLKRPSDKLWLVGGEMYGVKDEGSGRVVPCARDVGVTGLEKRGVQREGEEGGEWDRDLGSGVETSPMVGVSHMG